MKALKPWALGPFELLLHAEMHARDGHDFDRRIALISFDNSIEISVTTYLMLHPKQRRNRNYKSEDVDKWLANFHTKLDFVYSECERRSIKPKIDSDEMIWYHRIRNNQYHEGAALIPSARDIEGVRAASTWVFSLLYECDNVMDLLDTEIRARESENRIVPTAEPIVDRYLDENFGTVLIGNGIYAASEILRVVDPEMYRSTKDDLISEALTSKKRK